MNILLLDILACPIDKHSPLNMYIFSINANSGEIERISSIYQKKNIRFIQDEKIINYFEKNGNIYLKDKIIAETGIFKDYLKHILSKMDLLEYVVDETSNKIVSSFLKKITTEVKNKITELSLKLKNAKVEEILPDLYLINKILLDLKVDTGILFCQKCNRWYPIYEGIPQLLPDNQRNEKEEIKRFGKLHDKLNQVLKGKLSII